MDFPIIPNDVRPWRFTSPMRPDGGPAFGPTPSKVVPKEVAEDFVKHTRKLKSDARKIRAYHRFLIYTEDYASLIAARIAGTHSDAETIAELKKFVSLSLNLALDITSEVAVVWKHDAARVVKDASDEQNEAFTKLIEETRFRSVAKAWNRQAWFLGPIIVFPVMRGGRMSWDTLLPHFYDVIQDPDDPWGNPLAACWEVQAQRWLKPQEKPEANALLVDAEAYHYYDVTQGGKLISSERHGLGEFPGSTLRFDHTHATSWWGCDRHRRLVDATITVGALQSALEFIRKSQNKWLLAVTGDLSGFPKGQKLDPELGIKADADSPQTINIQTLNFDTDPKNFIAHAVWIANTVARSYGADLKLGSEAASGNSMSADVSFSYEAQTEIRNEQLPFAEEFERDLWAKTVAYAKRHDHELASKLPEPEKVRESLEVRYPPLSRTFASPSEETAYYDWELSKGLKTFGDLLIGAMPGSTAEERNGRVLDNIDDQTKVFDRLAKRDQLVAGDEKTPNAGPPGAKTAAQQFGAKGPAVRDGKAPPPNKEETDDNE